MLDISQEEVARISRKSGSLQRWRFSCCQGNKTILHGSGGSSSEAAVRHPLGGSVRNSHAAIVFVVVGGRHAGNWRRNTHGETNLTVECCTSQRVGADPGFHKTNFTNAIETSCSPMHLGPSLRWGSFMRGSREPFLTSSKQEKWNQRQSLSDRKISSTTEEIINLPLHQFLMTNFEEEAHPLLTWHWT